MFRLIQYLSYTKDFSFTKENNGISFDDTSVSHATVKDATGKVCMLVKIVFDVKSAFCLIPIEYRSDDVIKMKFVKLWDLLRYSERTTSKTLTRQKLAIRAKLSLRY